MCLNFISVRVMFAVRCTCSTLTSLILNITTTERQRERVQFNIGRTQSSNIFLCVMLHHTYPQWVHYKDDWRRVVSIVLNIISSYMSFIGTRGSTQPAAHHAFSLLAKKRIGHVQLATCNMITNIHLQNYVIRSIGMAGIDPYWLSCDIYP